MKKKAAKKKTAKKASSAKGNGKQAAELREFALSLPGAREDFPWGERVAKVGKKVFAFLGKEADPGEGFGFSVKLPESGEEALELPYCEPTAYGLGKSGWVSVSVEPGTKVSTEQLLAWVEESYRAVAPKKLVKELDAR
jgi:predicted DNA-binding protein (MmcQ/YjbR family)